MRVMIKLRALLVLFLLLFFSLSSFAEIELLEPIHKIINNNSSFELGSVQSGETINLSFYKNSSTAVFDSIKLDDSLLPSNWQYIITQTSQVFNVKIIIPKNESERIQKLNFMVFSEGIKEEFSLIVKVRKNLISTSIDSTSYDTLLNKNAVFTLSFVNDSVASHELRISSNLPLQWFKEKTITLEPKTAKEIKLVVHPRLYGKKNFYFTISSKLNDSVIDTYNIELNVYPSLREKYFAVFNGFPFFNLNLMPFMLFDGFLALLG